MSHTKKQKQQILTKAIAQAKKHNLIFLSDVIAYTSISRQTFYTWEFDKSDKLKEVLEDNKINIKVELRKKWSLSDNATLNIALYKLVANNEERKALADRQQIEHSGSLEQKVNNMSKEEREARIKELRKKLKMCV